MQATPQLDKPETVETERPTTDHDEPATVNLDEPVEQDVDERGDLSLDLAFELLQNERRRRVLEHLRAAEGRLSLGELAEKIAAQENDTTVDALTSSERKRVYVGLYQCHLPKMDDAGVVAFNQNRGHVELAHNADELEGYLSAGDDVERPWHRYYGGISAGGAGLLAGSFLGLLPMTLVMGLLVAMYAGCSGLHTFEARTQASG